MPTQRRPSAASARLETLSPLRLAGVLRVEPVLREAPRLGIDRLQPAPVGAEPQPALAVLQQGGDAVHPEAVRTLRVAAVVLEDAAPGAEAVEARVQRADPEVAVVVARQGHDPIAAEAALLLRIVPVGGHVPCRTVHHVETGIEGADPQAPRTILGEGRDVAAAQSRGVRRLRGDVAKLPAQRVPLLHPAQAGANPEHAAPVLGERQDVVVGQGRGVRRILAVVRERATAPVHQVEPPARAHPEPSVGVLQERPYLVVREAGVHLRVVAEPLEAAGRGIQAVQAGSRGADPEPAPVVLQDGTHPAFAEACRVGGVGLEVHELPGVPAVESCFGAYPQAVLAVDVQGIDPVVDEARGLGRVVSEARERAARHVQPEKACVAGADPEDSLLRRKAQRADRDSRQLLLPHDAVRGPLPLGQAAGGGDPEVAGGVFLDVPDEAARQRGRFCGIVLVDLEGEPVEAIEAFLRRQPDVPAPVLEDVHHRGLRQPLLQREAVEADGAHMGGHGGSGQ